jgi:hypothetical protein
MAFTSGEEVAAPGHWYIKLVFGAVVWCSDAELYYRNHFFYFILHYFQNVFEGTIAIFLVEIFPSSILP